MPVTTRPASHGAEPWKPRWNKRVASSATELLKHASDPNYAQMKSMRQSSFDTINASSNVYASGNGFLEGAYRAYTNHNHLIIRPEDVWLSILVQLNFYINANAEELRDMFVRHEGKKDLVLFDPTVNFQTADFSKLVLQFKDLLGKSVVNPKLKAWVMPNFSTTTECDEVVASSVFMASMQKYFNYIMMCGCGLPSVTLLGCRADWEALMTRLDKLPEFGDEPKKWLTLLKPVISRFVKTFDAPEAPETKDFWQKIAHHVGGGSAPAYLSGWITAFCFWDKHGKCLHRPDHLTTSGNGYGPPKELLELDGVKYHHVYDVAVGYASVPIIFQDLSTGIKHDLLLVAGSVGVQLSSSREGTGEDKNGQAVSKEKAILDTVQPLSGWWIFEKQEVTRQVLPPHII